MIEIATTVASDRCEIAEVTKLVRRFVMEKTESSSPPVYAIFAMAGSNEFLSGYLQKQAIHQPLRKVARNERSII